jgi:hypothetical protein
MDPAAPALDDETALSGLTGGLHGFHLSNQPESFLSPKNLLFSAVGRARAASMFTPTP